MRARALDPSRLEEQQLQNVVEEMALASGMPMPKLYVLPDADPNAFATGRSPEHASLGVTEGLLELLDREELQAVVAHEMGHIANLDIRTMMLVSVMMGALGLLADVLMRAGSSGSSGSSRNGRRDSNPLVLVLVGLLASVIGRMLAMAVSRTREFEADRSAAEFTRNPLALARALAKVEQHTAPTLLATQGTAHMFIVDPRVSRLNDRTDWMGNLFASHPPMKARIKRLEAMGYSHMERAEA
jgi:heat shock protein HtpX